eukprot:GDKI01044549.1.p1 GENE.GDKI01044549.1~~GDKI01044549.1.p1  ORF type:complete len:111 (+),score=1.92 GDKI01044549.1:24-356(+)
MDIICSILRAMSSIRQKHACCRMQCRQGVNVKGVNVQCRQVRVVSVDAEFPGGNSLSHSAAFNDANAGSTCCGPLLGPVVRDCRCMHKMKSATRQLTSKIALLYCNTVFD